MDVVAAIIERDGRVLVCQRKEGQSHAGKWEFPGGKVETGENLVAALARELREELHIVATIGPEITRYSFAYPGKAPIQLFFYQVTEFQGEPVNLIFQQISWERKRDLPSLDFLEGDVDFVKQLAMESSA